MSTFRGRNSLLQRFPLVYSRYNTNELSQKLAYDFVYDYTNSSSRKYSCEEKSVKDNTYLYYKTQDLVQILLASQGRHHKTYMYYNTCTRYLNSQSWQRQDPKKSRDIITMQTSQPLKYSCVCMV